MANEITKVISLRWSRQGVTIAASHTDNITQVGTASIENVQTIGTVSEPIVFGDVTDPAYIFFKNIDAVNAVGISNSTPAVLATAAFTLLPGKSILIDTSQPAWYAIAQTAPVPLVVFAIQR